MCETDRKLLDGRRWLDGATWLQYNCIYILHNNSLLICMCLAVVVIEFISTPWRVSKMASTRDGTKVFGRKRDGFKRSFGERWIVGSGEEASSTKTRDSRRRIVPAEIRFCLFFCRHFKVGYLTYRFFLGNS